MFVNLQDHFTCHESHTLCKYSEVTYSPVKRLSGLHLLLHMIYVTNTKKGHYVDLFNFVLLEQGEKALKEVKIHPV